MPKKLKVKRGRPKGSVKKQSCTCARCEKVFPSRQALKLHSKAHLQAVHELKLLEQGQIPDETKLGSGFKGKNRIIVT